jgi:uncharacterized protein (TIGR03437 family)
MGVIRALLLRSPSMFKGIFCGLLLSSSLIAQTLAGSGYTVPAPVSVAPGQIATFYVTGTELALVDTPPGTPPTVTLQQTGASTTAPIQSVRVVSQCPDVTAIQVSTCGSLTAITVQIPYELVPYCPLCAKPVSATPPLLTISRNGQALTSIELNPLVDEVHVLTACDVALGSPTPQQPNLTGLPCSPLVTHANGSLVSAGNPANAGEALTLWAFGLGQTNPAATTGQISQMAPTAETFNLDFNYQINALPVKPFTGEPDRIPLHPLFSGLAPGYVGLYQVNFTVPPGPANGIGQCAQLGSVALGGSSVQSNFTVSIGGQFSFDGAGICIVTQIPVD